MHYGVLLPNLGPYGDAQVLAELAHEAEESGWEGFFLWDQVGGTTLSPFVDPIVDPWIALTAVALRTSRVRIGTLVTPLPRRRPWQIARETASLDRLSGGRLALGVGSGGGARDFKDLGEPSDPKILAAKLDESLDIITGLWSGEPFHFEGAYYHIREAQFLPRPAQEPRIPIWVAGMWPYKAPLRRAARWDGVVPIGRDLPLTAMLSPTDIQAIMEYIKQQPGYTEPFEVVHLGLSEGLDAAQDRALVASYAAAGVTWWVENISPERWGTWRDWPVEAIRRRIHAGPPHLNG